MTASLRKWPLAALLVLLGSGPLLAQNSPLDQAPDQALDKAHEQALEKAIAESEAAWKAIESYGRGAAPKPPTAQELRERALARLSEPLRAPRQVAEPRPELDVKEHYEKLKSTRESILERLRTLAPDRFPEPAPASKKRLEPMRIQIFDLHDLTMVPEDHRAPSVGLGMLKRPSSASGSIPGGVLTFDDEGSEATGGVGFSIDKIVELLDRLLPDEDGAKTDVSEGRLIVRHRPDQLARIEPFLRSLRANQRGALHIELSAWTMSQELYQSLQGSGSELSEEAEKRLIQALTNGQVTRIASQELLAQDGQRVAIQSGASRSLVVDLSVDQTGVVPVVRPTVAVIHEGLIGEVRNVLDSEGKQVLVELSLSRSQLQAEGGKRIIEEVEVELPRLEISRLTASANVAIGKLAILGGVFANGKDRAACVITIRVRRADASSK